jgi:VHS domain
MSRFRFLILIRCQEAALHMLKFVKVKDYAVAIAALSLIDICAIHGGFPFQYALSRKEFINGLLKKISKPVLFLNPFFCFHLQIIETWSPC